eukprot:6675467-Karenia_brevis.AAC.1
MAELLCVLTVSEYGSSARMERIMQAPALSDISMTSYMDLSRNTRSESGFLLVDQRDTHHHSIIHVWGRRRNNASFTTAGHTSS